MAGYYVSLRPRGLENMGDDLHVTLAYLGKLDPLTVAAVRLSLTVDFKQWPGLSGNIFGVAVWITGPMYHTVGLVDGWYIHRLSAWVRKSLESVGVIPDGHYPFIPHVTLRSSEEPAAPPCEHHGQPADGTTQRGAST